MRNFPRPSTTCAPFRFVEDDLSIAAIRSPRTVTVISDFAIPLATSITVTWVMANVSLSFADPAATKAVKSTSSEIDLVIISCTQSTENRELATVVFSLSAPLAKPELVIRTAL